MISEKTPYFEKGTQNKGAIILSCPGQEEQKFNKPAAGSTGDNYNEISKYLIEDFHIDGFQRGNVTITNSWHKVEYTGKGGTGRSEATLNDIFEQNNLDRLADELKDITDFIMCCGVNAKAVVEYLLSHKKLKNSCKIIYVPHLGNQGLNLTIKFTAKGKPIVAYKKASEKSINEKRSLKLIAKDNRLSRLKAVAQQISNDIKSFR